MARDESLFSLPAIAGTIIVYWLVVTTYNFVVAPRPPTSIPWKGYGKGWIASLRNFFAVYESKDWILEGYEEYNKKNEMFVIPNTLGVAAEVVMPQSQLMWMFDQPDNVLSTSEAHYDFLQGDYCFIEPAILKDPYHEHVIHKTLVRNLNAIIPDLEEEVPGSVDVVYGTDTENFKEVEILDSFMKMIPRLTNRMLVGPTLAREQKYLDACLAFTEDVIRHQTIIMLFPKAFHPIVGNLLSLISKYHFWLSSRFTIPLIKKRIEDFQKKDAGDPEYKDWKEPHDFITWQYRTAMSEGRQEEMRPKRIAQRLMPINFASIHTTALTAYDSFVNILASDPSVVESLRAEAHTIFKEDGKWTKQGLSKMHRIDSAIRESQRFAPIALTFASRKVVAREGIVTPNGVHMKYGTLLSSPWTPIAHDDDFHAGEAKTFDAFRYSRPREEYEAMTPEEKASADALKLKQNGLVTTSDRHLPFGHGRHAW